MIMANLWDDITKTIREGVDSVVEKTEELTKIGRIKVDIINIKRNVEKSFAELGGKVYHLIVEEKAGQIADNKDVKEIIECVKILEKELREKNEQLKQVRTKPGASAQPATTETAPKTTPARKSTKKPAEKKPAAKRATKKPAAGKSSAAKKSPDAKAK